MKSSKLVLLEYSLNFNSSGYLIPNYYNKYTNTFQEKKKFFHVEFHPKLEFIRFQLFLGKIHFWLGWIDKTHPRRDFWRYTYIKPDKLKMLLIVNKLLDKSKTLYKNSIFKNLKINA